MLKSGGPGCTPVCTNNTYGLYHRSLASEGFMLYFVTGLIVTPRKPGQGGFALVLS
jgi:hypothetical protein